MVKLFLIRFYWIYFFYCYIYFYIIFNGIYDTILRICLPTFAKYLFIYRPFIVYIKYDIIFINDNNVE
jgi:hypothetical protein